MRHDRKTTQLDQLREENEQMQAKTTKFELKVRFGASNCARQPLLTAFRFQAKEAIEKNSYLEEKGEVLKQLLEQEAEEKVDYDEVKMLAQEQAAGTPQLILMPHTFVLTPFLILCAALQSSKPS